MQSGFAKQASHFVAHDEASEGNGILPPQRDATGELYKLAGLHGRRWPFESSGFNP